MILKIISDGNPIDGTKVVNAETGEELSGVCEVSWHLDHKNLAIATIKVYADVELAAERIDKIVIEGGAANYSKLVDGNKLEPVNREETKQD